MHLAAALENPLRTRADLQALAEQLWKPFVPLLAKEGAAISLDAVTASYGAPADRLETFVRPLWAVASLVAGGGGFRDADLIAEVLAQGVDPAHPHYWGTLGDRDQRAVEMSSLAVALWLAPELMWRPLGRETQQRLVAWLGQINRREVRDNNWHFFRVLVNGALASVGAPVDDVRLEADLQRLDAFYHGDGWYRDGATRHVDYYVPTALHLYGLVWAKLSGPGAPRTSDYLERARRFAPDFVAWFAPDGSALPMGRSLTYRFAQGAFWGALAFADLEALPWGTIKHLHLQHLRWWARQPIFDGRGFLTIGYAYPNQIMAEAYNAPGSPYWAAKAFLPLALPESHPFWTAEERPPEVPAVSVAPGCAGLRICRDDSRGHVFALANNPLETAHLRHAAQKYGKFVYSTAFAFSVPVGGNGPQHGAADSMLLVSRDGRDWRGREQFETDNTPDAPALHSRWQPWPGVEIDTWLVPALPGHVRLHRIQSSVTLRSFEGGFPLERTARPALVFARDARTLLDNGAMFSGIWDLAGTRTAEIAVPEPNTNLLHSLTAVPGLSGDAEPGETWLATAVAGLPGVGQQAAAEAWRDELRFEIGESIALWRGANVLWRLDRPASGKSPKRRRRGSSGGT